MISSKVDFKKMDRAERESLQRLFPDEFQSTEWTNEQAETPPSNSKEKGFLATCVRLHSTRYLSGLFFQLSITWETNEQYAHGYLVPILCLYLLLKTNLPQTLKKERERSNQF